MRFFNIPIFIPELACPFRCVYCNQYNISGRVSLPDKEEIINIITSHLETIPGDNRHVEIAFFGGSFTGLSLEQQNYYLDLILPFIESEQVAGVRISTRPDYIDAKTLENLKKHHVRSVELGAQSLNDEVLKKSGRGHTAQQVLDATKMLKEEGFETGLQMMTGLPGDNEEKAIDTAQKICAVGAHTTRIYPTLVIKDTPLEMLFQQGRYKPQTLEAATDLCARLHQIFNPSGVKILKTGLHPSESFQTGNKLVAGPFHNAFGEMVRSKVYLNMFKESIKDRKGKNIVIRVHPGSLNSAIGHRSVNKLWLMEKFRVVRFIADSELQKEKYTLEMPEEYR
ncbi:MAG: elongator complex protein 3 [Bacteroidales bacterium]